MTVTQKTSNSAPVICECPECNEADQPCHCDCDLDDQCTGCREAQDAADDAEFEAACARGER